MNVRRCSGKEYTPEGDPYFFRHRILQALHCGWDGRTRGRFTFKVFACLDAILILDHVVGTWYEVLTLTKHPESNNASQPDVHNILLRLSDSDPRRLHLVAGSSNDWSANSVSTIDLVAGSQGTVSEGLLF